MNVLCLFGHKWDGCTCRRCGKQRDMLHKWDYCKGYCVRCSRRCEIKHDLDGCVCRKCGAEIHKWDGCVCRDCGAAREMRYPTSTVEYYDKELKRLRTRCANYMDSGHKGPWEQDPYNPCIVICKACGKKAWNHKMSIHTSGIVGPSAGGGSLLAFPGGSSCAVCGYSAQAGRDTQSGYVEEEE